MARWFIPAGLGIAASMCLYPACSATNNTMLTGGAGGGIGGSGGSSSPDGGVDFDGCSGLHCSSDLHSLVDCNGNAVMTCPGDQGCSGTSCVTACTSASNNKSTFGCDYYVVGPDILLDG